MVHDLFSRYGTHLKLVAVVFVGLHIPLVMAGLVWLGNHSSDPKSLMLSVLLGTIGGLVISVWGIWSILQARTAVAA